MPDYAILQNPGHNRVYFKAAQALSINEFSIAARRLSAPITQVREQIMGGVPYMVFTAATPLTADDFTLLSRLSFTYALFGICDNPPGLDADSPLIKPLAKHRAAYFDEDLGTILKYSGKTNELFTRLLLNLAVFCSAFDWNDTLFVLDPVCGKGTALYECLLCGYHAGGVDIDDKQIHEAYIFLKRYLETARYKHETHTERVGGYHADKQKFTATRHQFTLARDKADQKAGKTLHVEMLSGDARYMDTYYKKDTFHAIVGDLPYGVQHMGKQPDNKPSGKKNPQGARNALGMLAAALPGWVKVLKPGGAMALAWNTFLIPRSEMEAVLTQHGLWLPDDPVFTAFAHRVDQAIMRDVVVGIKPPGNDTSRHLR